MRGGSGGKTPNALPLPLHGYLAINMCIRNMSTKLRNNLFLSVVMSDVQLRNSFSGWWTGNEAEERGSGIFLSTITAFPWSDCGKTTKDSGQDIRDLYAIHHKCKTELQTNQYTENFGFEAYLPRMHFGEMWPVGF